MKVTELMIGDWVQYKGHPVKVHALNVSDGYAIMEDQVSIELSKDTCMGIDARRLEPISLTPEILEKNGFIQCGEDSLYPQYNDCTHRFSDNRGHVVLLEYIGWSHGYYNVHNITTIHDVHELQHIFKIKKIKREIVL